MVGLLNDKRGMQSNEPELLLSSSAVAIRNAALFELAAAPGVLEAMGISNGLNLGTIASAEAILGFLAEIKCESGILRGSSGAAIRASSCRGLLARFGAKTGEPLALKDCLELLKQMGVLRTQTTGLLAGIRQYVERPDKRLYRCFRALEERGYHIRLCNRLSSICRVVPDADASASNANERFFSLPAISNRVEVAA